MKMSKKYIEPKVYPIRLQEDLMQENLPVGMSKDTTNSGDESGGGLSRGRQPIDTDDDNFWKD